MPIYEYTCRKCDQDFELLVRAEEEPACPSCGGQKLDKRFSVPAAHSAGGPSAGGNSLPFAGCGRPECGPGGCQGMR
jgi:putative FmdB family regulatory protein